MPKYGNRRPTEGKQKNIQTRPALKKAGDSFDEEVKGDSSPYPDNVNLKVSPKGAHHHRRTSNPNRSAPVLNVDDVDDAEEEPFGASAQSHIPSNVQKKREQAVEEDWEESKEERKEARGQEVPMEEDEQAEEVP